MAATELFGWELVLKSVQKDIKGKEDVIIALVHWFLTSKESFRCVGIGDDKILRETDVSSELLPDGWNDSPATYALRYQLHNKLYILLATKTEETLIINFLDAESRKVSNLALDSQEVVKDIKGQIQCMIPELPQLLDRFRKELIEPVFPGNTRDTTTQTQKGSQSITSTRDHSPCPPPSSCIFRPEFGRDDDLRNIGRGDLDPLGRGGGGMLFQPPFGDPLRIRRPLRPDRMFPPNARFDPFSPPDIRGGRPNPNPDHFRPPSDFSDMFM